jgi:hypothetical protein
MEQNKKLLDQACTGLCQSVRDVIQLRHCTSCLLTLVRKHGSFHPAYQRKNAQLITGRLAFVLRHLTGANLRMRDSPASET